MSQIADIMNQLLAPLQTYAATVSGKAIIASDLQHAWEYTQGNENFPKIILIYTGDRIRGDFQTASINRMADIDFSVVVSRNRSLTTDRGAALTNPVGNAIPLYQITEGVRDIIRYTSGLDQMKEWPVDYKGTSQWETGAFISDAYSINFSMLIALPAELDAETVVSP